jgi:spore coat protein CotF
MCRIGNKHKTLVEMSKQSTCEVQKTAVCADKATACDPQSIQASSPESVLRTTDPVNLQSQGLMGRRLSFL